LISGLCGKYGERGNAHGVVVGKQETDDDLVNIDGNGRNLKGIGWKSADWIYLAQGSSCEHNNELPGSINADNFPIS
jgi:hypothetical protein